MKFDIIIFGLSLFFIFIIIFGIFNKSVESFSDNSTNEYENVAPLPSDNEWSQETQTAFIQKMNQMNQMKDASANQITSTIINNTDYMTIASEEEAKYFIEKGIWTWDNYITNYVNKQTEKMTETEKKKVEDYKKIFPNRLIYKAIGQSTLPQSTILSSLNPDLGNGIVLSGKTNQIITCKYANKGTIKNPDGTNLVFPENGYYPYLTLSKNINNENGTYTLDNSIFESISGLSFDGQPCNICNIKDFNYLGAPFQSSNENKCNFSIKTPKWYDIYSGINKSTSS